MPPFLLLPFKTPLRIQLRILITIGFILLIYCFLLNLFESPSIPPTAPFNATLGFEKILLISLPEYSPLIRFQYLHLQRRTDRRDAMSLAFRISGISGVEVSPLHLSSC